LIGAWVNAFSAGRLALSELLGLGGLDYGCIPQSRQISRLLSNFLCDAVARPSSRNT
jgi:hypothetical protein